MVGRYGGLANEKPLKDDDRWWLMGWQPIQQGMTRALARALAPVDEPPHPLNTHLTKLRFVSLQQDMTLVMLVVR